MSRDRRNFYRIRTVLPVTIRREQDEDEAPLAPMSIDISGGGIGFHTNSQYEPGDILALTIAVSENELIRAKARVVSRRRLEHENDGLHIGAAFIEISQGHREALIRYVMRLQAERLDKHYLA
ncbi:MAG: flagellar brake protein [Nitrospiraceae bacterium]